MPRTHWLSTLAMLLALTSARSARSATTSKQLPRACSSAYSGAREREQSGQLRAARWLALQCAKASCGGLDKKCASAAGRLAASIAMVAPVLSDTSGALLVDVVVKVDGEQLANRLDGHELPVDPGVREFSFTARVGGHEVSLSRKVMIVEGQRGSLPFELPSTDAPESKPATVSTTAGLESVAPPDTSDAEKAASDPNSALPKADAAEAQPSPPAPRRGASPAAYLTGGAGLLALGAGGLLTAWGKSDNDTLSRCAPNCAPASLDHIRQMYLAADISFGVGAAALGVAAVIFAVSHKSSAVTNAASTSPAKQAFVFGIDPARSGGMATFGGTF